MKWGKARRKPVEVQYREIDPTWHTLSGEPRETIHTEGGLIEATKNDYIIKAEYDGLYPIKKYIFNATYDVIDEPRHGR